MSKTFRSWDVDQGWLLPPSVHDFVPPVTWRTLCGTRCARRWTCRRSWTATTEERGQPPYHPAMMVALLLYGYSRGVYSSRQLAQACEERVDFMAVTGLNKPDFRTISDVPPAASCGAVGAVRAGAEAVPGGGAGEAGACGGGRHQAEGQRQPAQGDELWPDEAERGRSWRPRWRPGWTRPRRPMRPRTPSSGPTCAATRRPAWMADKQQRLERIRAAKAALEAEAQADPAELDPDGPGPRRACRSAASASGPTTAVRRTRRSATSPTPTAASSPPGTASSPATTARSPSMRPTRSSSLSGCRPTRPTTRALVPLVDQAKANLGRKPREVSGDAGFATEANLARMAERRVRAYLAPGRGRHGQARSAGDRRFKRKPLMAAMAATLERAGRAPATACESRSSSPSSARSSRPEASDSSSQRPR